MGILLSKRKEVGGEEKKSLEERLRQVEEKAEKMKDDENLKRSEWEQMALEAANILKALIEMLNEAVEEKRKEAECATQDSNEATMELASIRHEAIVWLQERLLAASTAREFDRSELIALQTSNSELKSIIDAIHNRVVSIDTSNNDSPIIPIIPSTNIKKRPSTEMLDQPTPSKRTKNFENNVESVIELD